MEHKRLFCATVYDYSLELIEAMKEVDADCNPVWEISSKNAYMPQFMLNGQVSAVLVRKQKPATEQVIEKAPTKSQIIEKELIEEFGEEQIGVAAIQEPKRRTARNSK